MRIFHYIQQGGPIMYLLLIINLIGFTVMLYKFYILYTEKNSISNTADKLRNNLSQKELVDPTMIIELSRQEIAEHMSGLEKGISTVKIIASISPLLGLLGTVIGVLIAFQVMSLSGLSNPEHFAQGISMALLTTVAGLIVAIPHYVGHNYMLSMLDELETKLEKKLLSGLL